MSSSSRYSNSPVEKGAELKKGQDLITLPDTSQMMAVVRVHESHVRHVKPGMQAVVRVPAGAPDGPTVRLEGLGHEAPDAATGDLLVALRVRVHEA